MSKSFVLLLLGALFLAPTTLAQGLPAHSLDATIEGLPGTSTLNGTLMALPFTVRATVTSTVPCVATTPSSYTFNLAAELLNSSGNATTVQVSPSTFTVSGPGAQPSSVTRTTGATLLIDPGAYVGANLSALVRVTLSSPGGNPGCTGSAATAPVEAQQDVTAVFLPPKGYGSSTVGQEMPAPSAAFVLLGLALLVASRRRA